MVDTLKPVISFDIENELYDKYPIICGVDEAGRGPLAGPVAAAAVILPKGYAPEGLNDSKKLSEAKRERLFDEITENAADYCIAYASVEEIEQLNILHATMLAMTRAVEGLKTQPDFTLIDGNRLPALKMPGKAVISGDALSFSIAAASILAKVSRDQILAKMDEEFPQYGFKKHKGYGTALHVEALLKYGPCPTHRMSFLGKILGANNE